MTDADGVLVVQADNRTLAWTAVEITSAVDLSRPREYARLTVAERLKRVAEQQSAFVERLLALRGGETVALRWLSDGAGRIRAVLLGRVSDATSGAVLQRAHELARRLVDVPDHLVAARVEDPAEVRRLLMPFTADAAGAAQVRKRIRLGQPIRLDAGVAQYLGIESFATVTQDWTSLLDTFLSHPHPVALSVQLTPATVDADLRRTIEYEATRYGRLARPTDGISEIGARQVFPADRAAAMIAPLFEDALRRFSDRAFRFNILVMSPAPFDDLLLEAVGSTISPSRPEGPDRQQQPAPAAGFTIQRPVSSQQSAALQQSFWTGEPLDLPDPVVDSVLGQDRPGQRVALTRLRSLLGVDEAPRVFRLPAAIEGRLPGMLVTAPRDRARVVDPTEADSVVIGYQGDGSSNRDEVRLPIADLPRHAFVVGTPGSGKTNSALHLCEQLWQRQVPFMVIEPVNSVLDDYRWLATRPGFDDLLVFTVGDESVAPFRLNPFQLPPQVTVAAHISNLLACFEAAFGLWDPLPFLYRRALVLTYRRRGLYPDYRHAGAGDSGDAHAWPVLAEFVGCLAEVVDALGYQGEVGSNIEAASKLRAESLIEGACGPTLDCRRSFDLASLLGRPIVVELAGVGDNSKEQSLISLLLMNAVRAHRRGSILDARRRPHVLLIEEAHRIFPRAKPVGGGDQKEGNAQALAAERIAQGLAEDRKYGQSYVLIDQQVGKVGEDAYKITNLKVMHRTSSEEDRKLLGATMAMHGDQLDSAGALRPFEALVSHNKLDRAVTVIVPDIRAQDAAERGLPEAPLADDDELRSRHAALLSASDFSDAMAPFDECEGCTHRCAFRRQAEAAAVSLAPREDLVAAFETGDVEGLAELIVAAGGVAQGLGHDSPAAVLDFRVCLAVHSFRDVFPPSGWTDTDHDNARNWAALARAELLAGATS